jgi:DNA-binding MarR family transcriptional regulator
LRQDGLKYTVETSFAGRFLPRLVARIQEAQDRVLAEIGLTVKQAVVLLSCNLGEANTPAELAALYGQEVSSITRIVDRLERKKLLKRVRSNADHRQVILRITPKGRAAVIQAQPIAAHVSRKVWKGIGETERVVLTRIVAKMMKNLNNMGPHKRANHL